MRSLLTINSGSSSLKASLFTLPLGNQPELTALIERIGLPDGKFGLKDASGKKLLEEQHSFPNHSVSLDELFKAIEKYRPKLQISAVGHRVVHGGTHFTTPTIINPSVLAELQKLVTLAPEHLPQALDAINSVTKTQPNLPQVACFDTAFHRAMPQKALLYPLPAELRGADLMRYGFHGLSYEYIMGQLAELDPVAAKGKVIIAHLGNGASMAAVNNGQPMDTTMGFTPTGGLVMSTRTGDLDPGVIVYLLNEKGVKPDQLNELLNKKSGLLGISGSSSDMRDLEGAEDDDHRAEAAISVFCHSARKFIGALAASMGGLETLVFTAGIGENSAPVRERICRGLEFMGIEIDKSRNKNKQEVISVEGSAVTVRVIPTNENLMIARHTAKLIGN